MEEFLKPLTDEEREIIKLRTGLVDGLHHTLEEVGRRLKMTPDDVQEIEARAEIKLVSQNKPLMTS
jgi:RNA polymerase primary sigma factor